MANYASFFVPARRSGVGAVNIQPLPTSLVLKARSGSSDLFASLAPSSSLADRILNTGPLGILAIVAATAVVGYVIVKRTR